MQLTTNVVTATTSAAHNLQIGEQVYINTGAAIWDTWKYTPVSGVAGVPSATTFTYARTAGNVPATAVSGTVTMPWLGLVFDNRSMTYNDATDHVLVARGGIGADGAAGIHILNADGANIGEMKVGADISGKACTTNVATITTAQAHGLAVSQSVLVRRSLPDSTFDGLKTVTESPTPSLHLCEHRRRPGQHRNRR